MQAIAHAYDADKGAKMQHVYIYAITHLESNGAYIGSSVDPKHRMSSHKCELNANKHHCRHLQNAWNKYGRDAFVFAVVDEMDCPTRNDRIAFEVSWIAKAGTYNGLIASHDLCHFQMSPEVSQRLSDTLKAKMANDPEYALKMRGRGEALRDAIQSPEGRIRAGEITARRWSNPDQAKVLTAGLEKARNAPGRREAVAAARRDPKNRAVQSERMKAAWADPERRAKLKARQEARWNDPEAKARQAAKMAAIWAARRLAKASITTPEPTPVIRSGEEV